jgi:hypothetical protein
MYCLFVHNIYSNFVMRKFYFASHFRANIIFFKFQYFIDKMITKNKAIVDAVSQIVKYTLRIDNAW